MQPRVSVIIPCFNSGEFISDALYSVELCDEKELTEIIVIDDGSTDLYTLKILEEYRNKGINVLRQDNKGPGGARNLGIANAKGEYLLFLDSDNKIRKNYISTALKYLEVEPEIGVVYGKPAFFGTVTGIRFTPGEFSMSKILIDNYIDMCTIVRKSMLDLIGYFDESRVIIGHEDWELWIRAGANGWKFHFVNEILFDYRVRDDSLITQVIDINKIHLMKQYVYSKHWKTLLENYAYLFEQNKYYHFDKARPVRSFVKYVSFKFKK